MVERDAAEVDHVVDEPRGDDLAAQAVLADRIGKPLAERGREVREQVGFEHDRVGKVGREDLLDVDVLRVGDHHGELGCPQPAAGGLALRDLLVGREVLERTVDHAVVLQCLEIPRVDVDHRKRLTAGDHQRQRLRPVVVEDEFGDLVGHLDEQVVALLRR